MRLHSPSQRWLHRRQTDCLHAIHRPRGGTPLVQAPKPRQIPTFGRFSDQASRMPCMSVLQWGLRAFFSGLSQHPPKPAHLGRARHSLAEAGKAMRAGLVLLLISCGAFDVSSSTCALVLLRLPDARLTGRSTADTERGVQCGGRPSRSGGSGGQDV
jgi:hypothetical protein